MRYITCLSCYCKAACDEAGACQGAATAQAQYAALKSVARSGAAVAAPAASAAPRPPAAPPRVASTPGHGSVTERIFAACDAALAEIHASGQGMHYAERGLLLVEARQRAIPRLEAAGVNSNSARKGSHMWLQAKKEGANQR